MQRQAPLRKATARTAAKPLTKRHTNRKVMKVSKTKMTPKRYIATSTSSTSFTQHRSSHSPSLQSKLSTTPLFPITQQPTAGIFTTATVAAPTATWSNVMTKSSHLFNNHNNNNNINQFNNTISPTPLKTLPTLTTSTRNITLLRTTSVTTSPTTQQNINPVSKKLVIPTTRPFSSSPDDHDHGAYERRPPSDPSQAMKITIVDREGVENIVDCKVGDNVLQLMRIFQEKQPKLFLEGACESSLACSTCHIILDDNSYNILTRLKEATEEEEDLLDMASCLTPTSRLGCQVNLVKEMDGGIITLPKFSRNFYVDGHVPQPH